MREFRRLFADQPQLLEGATADSLPTSFRIDLAGPVGLTHYLQALVDLPGVDEVQDRLRVAEQCQALDRLTS